MLTSAALSNQSGFSVRCSFSPCCRTSQTHLIFHQTRGQNRACFPHLFVSIKRSDAACNPSAFHQKEQRPSKCPDERCFYCCHSQKWVLIWVEQADAEHPPSMFCALILLFIFYCWVLQQSCLLICHNVLPALGGWRHGEVSILVLPAGGPFSAF